MNTTKNDTKSTAATPAGRFRRAAKELRAAGIHAELLRSCCQSCTAGTAPDAHLVAVEMDGTQNDPRGWFRTLGSLRRFGPSAWDVERFDEFTEYVQWRVPAGQTQDEFLRHVGDALTRAGFEVELPANADTAIGVRAAR